jgi:hypothetical protein
MASSCSRTSSSETPSYRCVDVGRRPPPWGHLPSGGWLGHACIHSSAGSGYCWATSRATSANQSVLGSRRLPWTTSRKISDSSYMDPRGNSTNQERYRVSGGGWSRVDRVTLWPAGPRPAGAVVVDLWLLRRVDQVGARVPVGLRLRMTLVAMQAEQPHVTRRSPIPGCVAVSSSLGSKRRCGADPGRPGGGWQGAGEGDDQPAESEQDDGWCHVHVEGDLRQANSGGVAHRWHDGAVHDDAGRRGQTNGVTLVVVDYFRPADRRPSKVISKAFRAGFQRIVHRRRRCRGRRPGAPRPTEPAARSPVRRPRPSTPPAAASRRVRRPRRGR